MRAPLYYKCPCHSKSDPPENSILPEYVLLAISIRVSIFDPVIDTAVLAEYTQLRYTVMISKGIYSTCEVIFKNT